MDCKSLVGLRNLQVEALEERESQKPEYLFSDSQTDFNKTKNRYFNILPCKKSYRFFKSFHSCQITQLEWNYNQSKRFKDQIISTQIMSK